MTGRPFINIVGYVALAMLLTNLAAGAAAVSSWPEFRGPSANGVAEAPGAAGPSGPPLTWSETENVRWKTPIPHKGWSTPVILDGQIWLTTATPAGTDFFAICLDAESGEILFNEPLFHTANPEPLFSQVNSYASPSPVIEPGRVYVHFGSYGTACLDTATGKVVWKRDDLPCRHYVGPGTSPVLFENLLILTFDGVDVQYLAALDKSSGRTVWKTDRGTVWHDLDENGLPKENGTLRKSFSTPLVIDADGSPQLIAPGATAAFAYDPRNGREIWKTHNDAHTPVARSVFANGIAFIATGYTKPSLWAVRVDGHGDVTDTHIVWKLDGGLVPSEPSPLVVGNLLYMVNNDGAVTCLETATGKICWTERIGGNYEASPVYVNGRIYACSVQGKTTVLKVGPEFEVLATNRLDTGLMASPAIAGNAIFLRTKTHLYRIEAK